MVDLYSWQYGVRFYAGHADRSFPESKPSAATLGEDVEAE